ncbi:MFS transporter [Actinosynnema pretiosum subsp. pretiosum]|uniref:MFS transporter n=1 Tax=Actinosynnema pretiosum subsp. pretiosum TaxID=103721 RepID=A0AA45R5H0_9PSEU|nr:putative integral membrane transport protein [Actinosynnema pretiosum subsp. pretiosum]QUF05942.1 MFS transporter [Actinosynnema pretiosum subsp. pretiosum]
MGRTALVALFAHSTLTQVVTFMLRPTMAYRALELDVPPAWLGLLSAGFAVVPLAIALPLGHWADRVGERWLLVSGAALLVAAGGAFLLLGDSAPGLLVATAVLGTGHLCAVIGQQSLVANSSTSGRFDSAFGYYTFAASLGQLLGPPLIPLLGGARAIPDTAAVFTGATALAGVLLVSSLFLRRTGVRAPERGEEGATGLGGLLRLPGLLRALVTSCVVLAAVDISLVYLPALGTERGLDAGAVGLLLGLRAAASMTSRLFLGRLSAWWGRKRLLLGSVALAAAGMGAVVAPMPLWALAVAVVVAGLGLGVGQPVTMSWLAESAPPGLRGRAMSLRLTGNRAGQVVIPGAVGLLAGGLGAAGVLGLTAVCLAVVGVSARKLRVDSPVTATPKSPRNT